MILFFQIVSSLIVFFFVVGVIQFISKIIQHTRNTKEALRRIEEKLDKLIEDGHL